MTRVLTVYLLVFVMVFASLSLAGARGTGPYRGTEMVICSGVAITTVFIGSDGQPVEQVHVCPDGASIFAASFALPELKMPVPVLLEAVALVEPVIFSTRVELTPSARGPPSLI